MSLTNAIALLYGPSQEWQKISEQKQSISHIYLTFLIFFAAIPPVSAFIGATYVGWSVGDGATHKLTSDSALYLSIVAYFAILVAVFVISAFIQWMAKTYGAAPSLAECVNLTAYSCTPLFLVGILGSFPILWLDMLFSLIAIAMAVNLLYKGVPKIMGINQEKGFLFASSILTVCMVSLVGMLAITIVFWGSGLSPVFTS
ncbi:Yip1 family protein [Aliikangiella sp. G2MR2-5]|uniref:Yip1 family protein n=1 Tax=Aliikangiella sp. G2MR2-5 TaxID=2788943 RepID=UPI0018A94EF6|nr:Yip1 family protein [Aliikangiella sp. G2MR2-5]